MNRLIFQRKIFFFFILLGMNMSGAASKFKILFVCSGNTGRSVIAEALAVNKYKYTNAGITVFSRGMEVNKNEKTVEKNAITLLNEMNIDVSHHQAQQLKLEDLKSANLILVMTQEHKEKIKKSYGYTGDKIYTLLEVVNGDKIDIQDAYGKDINFYQNILNQIDASLEKLKNNNFKPVKRS